LALYKKEKKMINDVRTAPYNKKGTRQALIAALAVLVLGFAAVTSTSAQTAHVGKKKNKKSVAVSNDEAGVGASGQQAAIDPQTGKLREPTPEEARRLSEGMKEHLKPSKTAPRVVQLADGTLSMELTEEHLDFTVVKVNPDGTLSMECVKGASAAKAFVGAATGSPPGAAGAGAPTVESNNRAVAQKSSRSAAKRTTRKANRKGVTR
jgi:hypothetical protein